MSEHSLPPDPSEWPRDPFRLLGVAPGASARDLRKAYLRLIRSYKPEHSPEEFQRIRAAYEFALPFTQALERPGAEPEDAPESGPPPPPEGPTRRPDRPEGRGDFSDPWEAARLGDFESAYRSLVDRQDGGRGSEGDYLRLYWLLALRPATDPGRSAVDWLIRGLEARGAGSYRLRELLRRELAANPDRALGDGPSALLRPPTPPPVALDVAETRWRAAREAGRWGLIAADVEVLREWLPEVDEAAWARALIASAMALAWAEGPESALAPEFAREVERLGARHRDHSDDLYQLEYAQVVRAGLERLGGRLGRYSGVYRMLSLSWDGRGPESRARLRAYVGQVARGQAASLRAFDEIRRFAPAVLARLADLLGGLDFEPYAPLDRPGQAGVVDEVRRLLAPRDWSDYPAFRPHLLAFCLREAISPGQVARLLSGLPEFIMTGKEPLARAIVDDEPLRHAYRACEVAREGPGEG